MKNGRLRLFGLAAVLCTLLTGRSKTVATGTDQPPVKPSEPSCRTATGPPPPFLSRRAPPPVAHYSGTIGRLPVVLILRRSGGTLAGFYFYDKIRSPIQLRGEVRDDDFTLAEFGDVLAPEKRTGTFDGHTEAAPDVLRGTWSSADGQRRLPFMLTRGAPQVTPWSWARPPRRWTRACAPPASPPRRSRAT